MKVSKLFTKTTKDYFSDVKNISQQYLLRGGFVDQLMAGVYTFLPLGYRTYNKVEQIVREEMDEIGGQEFLMPALHPKENWARTDRWKVNEMFKVKSQTKKEYGLGWTHEEIITPLFKKYINSYKDLPLYGYQIQTKFRDELRAKSGLLRLREFAMKDLYSFHASQKDLDDYYEKVKKTYFKTCQRLGVKKQTFLTFASGGAFSKYSHEFQTITEVGEDIIYICEKCKLAINKELIKEQNYCVKCGNKKLEPKKAIEIGNIFKLGERFSKPFNLTFVDKDQRNKYVIMGCYGFGIERVIGAIVEVNHDKDGIIWPMTIAPYQIYLINLDKTKKETEKIYSDLLVSQIEVLWDDREESAGVKFADADLLGIPIRVTVSPKTLAKKSVEIKLRDEKKLKIIKITDLESEIKKIIKDKMNKLC